MKPLLNICAALAVLVAACQRTNTPPAIFLPENVPALSTNDSLSFNFTATDDHGLAQAGYRVFTNGDTIPGILPGWQRDELFGATGKTFFGADTLPVPDSISAGNYQLVVFATDEAGLSDSLTSTFAISSKVDSLVPALDSLVSPDTIDAGQQLSLYFSISDDTRLAFARYKLTNFANDSTLANNAVTLSGTHFADSVELDNLESLQRVRFELTFYDWVNNKTTESTDIIIRE